MAATGTGANQVGGVPCTNQMNICVTLALAAIALALWSCPAHAFCEPTEEEIAAARVRIEAREASGTVGMGNDVAMVMDADNVRKRRGAVRFRLRLSQFPRVVADEIRRTREGECVEPAVYRRSLSGPWHTITSSTMQTFPVATGLRIRRLCAQCRLNPRPGKWVRAKGHLVFSWRTIRRGGRTLLVTRRDGHMCGPLKYPPCVSTHRASRGKLVEISRVRGK